MRQTRRRRLWLSLGRFVTRLFYPLGLHVTVDFSSGIGYYLLDAPLSELLRKSVSAHVEGTVPLVDHRLADFVGRNSSCLDIGCGTGRLVRFLAPRAGTVTGIDASRVTLWLAARTMKGVRNATLRRGTGVNLPIPDKSMDLVFSRAVLVHVSKEDAFCILRESARVAREDAVVSHDFALLSEHLEQFVSNALSGNRCYTRERLYTRREVEILCLRAGLDIFDTMLKKPGTFVVFARPSSR